MDCDRDDNEKRAGRPASILQPFTFNDDLDVCVEVVRFRPVDESEDMTVIPRWLELQAEIDYRIFLLNEMRRELEAEDERLTPLDRLIDEATGHDEARLAEAEEIIAEIKTLRAEWDALAEETS